MTTPILGIDFGTSTSLVAESTSFAPQVVPLGRLDSWLPSVVGLDGTRLLVGEEALLLPEHQVVRSVKRAITRKDPSVSVFDGASLVELDADRVISAILQSVRAAAVENSLDLSGEGTVRLGCPAMWTGQQRQRLLELAQGVGLPVGDSTLIDEPIAAGISWVNEMVRKGNAVEGKVLVFDMGGGTLDVGVLDVEARPGYPPAISVQSAVSRDEAGDQLDDAISDDIVEMYREAGFDVAGHPREQELRGIIRRKAGEVKIDLGGSLEQIVAIDKVVAELPVVTYTRAHLEHAFSGQLDRAMKTVEWALRAAVICQVRSASHRHSKRPSAIRKLHLEELLAQVDYVVLAGGMSRIPVVQSHFARYVPADRIFFGGHSQPAVAIVQGLAEDLQYDRLNLHRPGFHFVLEWKDEATGADRTEIVYRAYEPLYDMAKVMLQDSVAHYWRPASSLFPRRGTAVLRARSVAGLEIDFRIVNMAGIKEEVAFTFGDFGPNAVVKFEPNGQVFMRDAAQNEKTMEIRQWPSIRGRGHETVTAFEVPRRGTPAPPVSRDRNKEG